MLDEYSIEQRATQIFDAPSKEYPSEALSSSRPATTGWRP